MTWFQLYSRTLIEMGRRTSDSRITDAIVLGFLSEAQHLLQSETAVVRKLWTLQLIKVDTGLYTLPQCVNSVDSVTYSPTTTVPQALIPVQRRLWDDMRSFIFQQQQGGIFDPNINIGGSPPQVMVSFLGCHMQVWPYSQTGFLTLRVIPMLEGYTDDGEDWKEYGTAPTSRMKIYGPEREMQSALEGIKAYAKMKMAEMIGLDEYRSQYPVWEKTWEKSRRLVRRNSGTDYQAETATPLSLGAVRF